MAVMKKLALVCEEVYDLIIEHGFSTNHLDNYLNSLEDNEIKAIYSYYHDKNYYTYNFKSSLFYALEKQFERRKIEKKFLW